MGSQFVEHSEMASKACTKGSRRNTHPSTVHSYSNGMDEGIADPMRSANF